MAANSEIEYIQFGIAGDEDHRAQSVVAVNSYELFGGTSPIEGGVYDARMGTTDHGYPCQTCGNNKLLCPGHPGSHEMRVGVQNPLMIADTRRWARITCLECGAPMVDLEKFKGVRRDLRLKTAATSSVTEYKPCPECKTVHPKIIKDDEDYMTFRAQPSGWKPQSSKDKPPKLYPHMIARSFGRISNETVEALGKSLDVHPRKAILTVIQAPPISIRPGVRSLGPAGASYHDITNMLQYLVKKNLGMPERMPDVVDRETARLIQNAQQLYYDLILGSASTNANQGAGGKRGLVLGSRSATAVLRRIPRKEGRIRRNLVGKRVWSISRSTIAGNTRMKIYQIGYPVEFARTVQIAETVQEYNRDRLMTYFLNGQRKYPGCTRVRKRATRMVHDVGDLRHDFSLEVGDVIYRDIVTGDIGFYNRQPSLERSAIGVHEIVVLEDPTIHTFQMNVSACDWYGADFDGDQMNLWVPHETMTRAEAGVVSHVTNWFISTKNSGPVNGEVQDANVGSFELTREHVRMDRYHAMSIHQGTGLDPPIFEGDAGTVYSGREVVSMLFAQHAPVNYERDTQWYNENYSSHIDYLPSETRVRMQQGVMQSGVLDRKSVGAKTRGGIFHLVSREHGPRKALDMVYALQQMALEFVGFRGFTIATGDMLVSERSQTQIHEIVSGLLRESELVTQRLLKGGIIPPIGMTTHEFYERLQVEALKVPDEMLGPILQSIYPDSNGLFKMIATKSKGNPNNMIHIMGAIGQITINTERIREQFAFRRTLPYFPRYATSAKAYGFVSNSYMTGLTNAEFIFSDMNSRFDLINKALSTASTGYQTRKSIMSLQPVMCDNLRHASKGSRIVQMLYGDDGLDARQVELVKFRTVGLSDAQLRDRYAFDVKEHGGDLSSAGTPEEVAEAVAALQEEFAQIVRDRDTYREIFMRFEDMNFNRPMRDAHLMPVNVERIVRDVRASGHEERPQQTLAGLLAMRARVAELCAVLPYTLINEIQEKRRSPIPRHIAAATSLLCILIRAELCSRVLVGLSDAQLAFVIESIRLRYSEALIAYGMPVGVLAAQAVSEPLTQYMLDSHHRSVSGGTNKAGLVRVHELLGAKKVEDEQSSEMLLRPDSRVAHDRAAVQDIANSIELMDLRRFVRSFSVLFEPYGALPDSAYPPLAGDREWIEEFERAHPLLKKPADLTRWCLRFELDKSTMILKGAELELIVGQLRAHHPHIYLVHTPENVPSIYLRVYIRATQFRRGIESEEKVEAFREQLLGTIIRGVPKITNTKVVSIIRHKIVAEGDKKGALVRDSGLYAIQTTGTNLYGVLMNQKVDAYTITSTSVDDTYNLLGIEAARQKLISEIRALFGDGAPNHRHIMIYADEMTRLGRVVSLERKGLTVREHNDVLLRMTMSAPIQVLTDAATNNMQSPVTGISGPLLLGRIPHIGTLWSDVVMDEDFIAANIRSVDQVLDDL